MMEIISEGYAHFLLFLTIFFHLSYSIFQCNMEWVMAKLGGSQGMIEVGYVGGWVWSWTRRWVWWWVWNWKWVWRWVWNWRWAWLSTSTTSILSCQKSSRTPYFLRIFLGAPPPNPLARGPPLEPAGRGGGLRPQNPAAAGLLRLLRCGQPPW